MEDIYYLIHTTNNPECISWDELKTGCFNTDDQFPGVYMSVITKDNIENESIYPGKYIMIFSKILLNQINYHINARDYNGIIAEKNTYYPWNLREFLDCKDKCSMNEIIFHDNIDIKYCLDIINATDADYKDLLPKTSIDSPELRPNISYLPFFCYPFEAMYSGINPLPTSSKEWYIMMSKMADITIDDNTNIDDIVEKIREKSEYLYMNRYKQKIMYLKEYCRQPRL
jgi:hypothetical protein